MSIKHLVPVPDATGWLAVTEVSWEERLPGRGRGTWTRCREFFLSAARAQVRAGLREVLPETYRNVHVRTVSIDCTIFEAEGNDDAKA